MIQLTILRINRTIGCCCFYDCQVLCEPEGSIIGKDINGKEYFKILRSNKTEDSCGYTLNQVINESVEEWFEL